MSTLRASPSFDEKLHTSSLERKKVNQVLRISKDIRNYLKDIDFYLSKIKSARDHILNLQEDLARITESIAVKEDSSWNMEDYLVTEEDLQNLGIDQHGTNLPQRSETPVLNMASKPVVQRSPPNTQVVTISPDLRCYETFSPFKPLKPGTTYLCGGTMVRLPPESQEEHLKNSQKLTEKMQELSGSMGTWDKQSV